MTATNNPVKVGDKMLFVNGYGARPTIVTVCKVTKTGQIRFVLSDANESELFKPSFENGKYERAQKGNSRYADIYVYSFSEEKAAAKEKDQQEKQDENARKRQERNAQIAAETEAAKAAMGGSYNSYIRHREMLDDGSRVLLIAIPVKPELIERKGRTELVMIRIKDVTDRWAIEEEGPQVEYWLTYVNKGSFSFSSCSGSKEKTDDDAIWEAIRYVRESW